MRYEFSSGALKPTGLSYIDLSPRREGDGQRWSESWSRFDFNASDRMKLMNRATNFSLVVRNITDREYRVDRATFAPPPQFVGSVGVEFCVAPCRPE